MTKAKSTTEQLANLPLERRWRRQRSPSPAVVALIERTNTLESDQESAPRFLLIQRAAEPYDGRWALVGGKWEFGETLQEAIIREVKEETGLEATFIAARGLVSERVLPTSPTAAGAHYLLFVCELSADRGIAAEQGEGPLAWFTRAEIEQLHAAQAIIPTDYAMINSFARAPEALPHVEAEMCAAVNQSSAAPIQMLRYEHIDGHQYSDDSETAA
ncbi:MAG: NUDIX domain-containing protein [Candidatus Promineifilaceae bacterium]|nr:NUDIX domain-containing protein [Candidatus Promineifilaceae bacterium]